MKKRKGMKRRDLFYLTVLFFLLVAYLCSLNPLAVSDFFKVLPAIITGAI